MFVSIWKRVSFDLIVIMYSGFILVFFLAAFGLAIAGVCDRAPDVNGCSIPGNLPYPYKNTFRRDCNKHDICYSCGKHYGIRRSTCDSRFYRNIKSTCNSVSNPTWCKSIAFDYYTAVRIGGSSHYKQRSPKWCSRSYVSGCIA
ncbi:conodipine-P3-like isoform X1 [Mya arenaria]|uniref:conodipine-P3-like isoform X1 n=2 Tax=Mya arenaria TaxID=6604 RepID=UPI0022E8A900|nr:conodipine-P3-like isoform X1 [Mya arenaria]